MHFRVEGEDLNPPVLFTAGTFVTVERQGEEARVGLVKQLNPDGTYHVVSDLTAKVNKALSTFPTRPWTTDPWNLHVCFGAGDEKLNLN